MTETTLTKNDILSYQVDADGVALITIDMEHEPTNLFSMAFVREYIETAQRAVADPAVKGVVVTSAKKEFMAGADLKFMANPPENSEDLLNDLLEMHRNFRQLEHGGKPFVAAINGTCLGGGYELAQTCHHRIALNNNRIKIGFPEVNLGLFPGGGGTQRTVYLMGIMNTLTNILQAKQHRPDAAKGQGFVDALADTPEALLAAARQYILDGGSAVQPWDKKGFKIPGGGLMTPNGVQTMVGTIGNVRKRVHGNIPGVQYALSAIHDGIVLPIDRGLEVEARFFVKAFYSKESQNLIRTGFFAINEAKKGKAKPAGHAPYEIKKVGVLGAGMMGAGIAFVSAKAGIDVVLKDVSQAGAEKGKGYTEQLLKKRLSKGRTTPEKMAETLARIHATDQASDVAGCDLVIEAVFEDPTIKATVTQESEAVIGTNKIYATNTSTLPITSLAKASARPENFIGMHFFSPVDKMPLVELIVGEKTSDYAVSGAIDYVTKIGKVPIVVSDSRGFFTSRVFGTFTGEGALMLEEGVPAALIENRARTIGMPVGPLAVTDEVTLTLPLMVMKHFDQLPPDRERVRNILTKLVHDHGRTGKKDGKGFYDYPENGKKRLWKGLSEVFPTKPDALDPETVGKRMLHIMALESYRCLEEGVLHSEKDGDIGSLLGFGFPPYTGGVFSYIQYVGLAQFIADCDDFAQRFGPRFTVPDSLRKKLEA